MKKELLNLDGKIALVTGAAAGLGKRFAVTLADAGADLVIMDVNRNGLDETENELKEICGSVLKVAADVSDPADVKRMFEQIIAKFGRLDIAVNNAGIVHKPYRFHEIPLEEWNRLISINQTGVFICMKNEIPLMIKQKSGVIINITSVAGVTGMSPVFTPRASYVAAKHAVIGLTKQAALEYADDDIRVNAIAPGWFGGTDIARERLAGKDKEVFKQRSKNIINLTPMKRYGKIQELDGVLLFLASEASTFVTGQTFVIDGGWTVQ